MLFSDIYKIEVVELCTKSRVARPESQQRSPTLSSGMNRPDTAQAVEEHWSRSKTKNDAQ